VVRIEATRLSKVKFPTIKNGILDEVYRFTGSEYNVLDEIFNVPP